MEHPSKHHKVFDEARFQVPPQRQEMGGKEVGLDVDSLIAESYAHLRHQRHIHRRGTNQTVSAIFNNCLPTF